MATMIPPAGAGAFLDANGWAGAVIAPLAGDASFRRYFRVTDGARRAVLMDAPPPHEDPRPFVTIARWLSSKGFASPAILAADEAQGLVLLEDFGDRRMRETVDADAATLVPLYEAAVDVLVGALVDCVSQWGSEALRKIFRDTAVRVYTIDVAAG